MRALYLGWEWLSVGDAATLDKPEKTHDNCFETMMEKTARENKDISINIGGNPSDFEIGLTKPLVKNINKIQRATCKTEFCGIMLVKFTNVQKRMEVKHSTKKMIVINNMLEICER